MKPRNWMSSIP